MMRALTLLALAVVLSHSGCATQFETSRGRVLVGGLLVFAVVSNKATRAETETKDDQADEGEEKDG